MIKIGNDILEIKRIAESLKEKGDRFLQKVFTEKEIAYFKDYKDMAPRVAGRFAAKEAIAKALGTGFGKELSFHDIEILPNEKGAPIATVKKYPNLSIELSISHCKEYAIATALCIQK